MGCPSTEKAADRMPCLGIRHLQLLLLTLCNTIGYMNRVNLSVAIVAMTQGTHGVAEFYWSPSVMSAILSSFLWGYSAMNIPASILGMYFSTKQLLAGSFLVSGLLSIATPVLTIWGGASAMITLRVGQGLAQSFMLPMLKNQFAKWAPPTERARFYSIIQLGQNLGTVLIMTSGGVLAEQLGWSSIFFFSGGCSLLWMVLYVLLGADSPSEHTWISKAERDHIESSLPAITSNRKSVPWKAILLSPPVIAIHLATCGDTWGRWMLLTEMPTFLNRVSGYDILASGFLSALPYLAASIAMFPLSFLADTLIMKGVTSIQLSRKLWNSVGQFSCAIALVTMGCIGYKTDVAMYMYILAVSLGSCVAMGYNVNDIDLSTTYAGVIAGATNTVGQSFASLGPVLVGFVVTDVSSIGQWQLVFYISGLVLFLTNVGYVLLGKAVVQPWN